MALGRIIIKNLKLLIRSRGSALIIVIGPLLLIFLAGIAFSNINKYSLNIGVYSDEYSDLTESFILKLQENEFRVQKTESIDICIEMIKEGRLHTCILFPAGLSLESNNANEVVFHVDYSKINLVWMVLDTISTKLEERASELSLELTSTLLDKIELARVEIYNSKPKITNLKSSNQELTNQFLLLKQEVVTTKLSDLKIASADLRKYIVEKASLSRDLIEGIKEEVDDLNISNSTAEDFMDDFNSVSTLIYNIISRVEDPNNITENDWGKISRLIEEIESKLNEVLNNFETLVISTGNEIDTITASIDKIYDNIEGIKIKDATTIVSPITTNIKPVVPEKTHLGYMFPALIILIIMFMSILLSKTLVMMEKNSPAYFRNLITPTKNIIFILGTYLTNMILVAVQIAIIIAISIYFLKSQAISNIFPMIVILFLVTTLFTFVGMAIGYIFKSEETATLAAISIGSIFLFLSNTILPLESMPAQIGQIAQFNPFVIGDSLLRKALLFNAGFKSLLFQICLLLIYSAVLFAGIWIAHVISKKHPLKRIIRHKK